METYGDLAKSSLKRADVDEQTNRNIFINFFDREF
jgi:hypothetical protein